MSPRVTRSAARKSADNSASISNQLGSPTGSRPVAGSRKRKASDPEPEPSIPAETNTPATRRTKKLKQASPELLETPPIPPSRQRKGKAKVTMAEEPEAPTLNKESSDSPPTASTSHKRKSARNKSPDEQEEIQPKASTKKTRPSSSRKQSTKSSKNLSSGEGETEQQAEPQPAENVSEDSEGDSPQRDYEDEDAMDEDPFESSFLGRHGGASSMQNTLRALTGMMSMSGMTSRMRQILEHLRQKDDPSIQLIALQDLSETLLISNEDNLAGHFSPQQFIKELIQLMQPSEFGENAEMMLLACRCVANMMEALPASTAQVVHEGAVPILISKLMAIEYMDVAEQALITLEKISSEFPGSIVRESGLSACLQYLDFFPTSVQRTAVTTAANCCRNIPDDSFDVVKEVMPILLNVLNSSDQRVVEQGCLCICRIAESFKYQDDRLEELMTSDILQAILRLLHPGSTNLVGSHIHTQFLRVLSYTARASPSLTVELFKLHIVDTLYQILTGVSPPSGNENVAQSIDSVVVMQALIHRPRDQIFEALNVICHLLPDLDKEGLGYVNELHDLVGPYSEPALSRSNNSSIVKRMELLADCKPELQRFAVVLMPTLTDAYSSTVNLSVRQKVLTAQLKMLSHLHTNILEEALRPVPYASYLASILSQQDHPFLVTAALQAAELLLKRLEKIYRSQFYREGVMSEVRMLADRTPTSTKSEKKDEGSSTSPKDLEPSNTSSIPSTPEIARAPENVGRQEAETDSDDEEIEAEDIGTLEEDLSDSDSSESPAPSMPTAPVTNVQDLVTKLAQRFIANFAIDQQSSLRDEATRRLDDLRALMSQVFEKYDSGDIETGAKLFGQLSQYFTGDALESITSYELLTSKIVKTLLQVLSDPDGTPNVDARLALLENFMGASTKQMLKTTSSKSPATPFSILISKLQDLLSRAEHYEVMTVHSNSYDSNRSSAASMLAKQIRIKLVADDESGIPRNYRNIMVSIHAIATFKALDDYLRPRISLAERVRSTKHRESSSSTTQANASTSSKPAGSRTVAKSGPTETPTNTPPQPKPTRSSRKTVKPKASTGNTSTRAVEETGSRRSSRRLNQTNNPDQPQTPRPPPPPPVIHDDEASQEPLECADEASLSDEEEQEDDTGALSEIVGEFEEEVEQPPDPSAVNMEVASTGKVTARQDDGTRIATPTQGTPASGTPTQPGGRSRPFSSNRPFPSDMARSLLSSLGGRSMSYAAALQSVPQDWHLEFSVNNRPISNETTIYSAVHHHQLSSNAWSARNTWSQVHTIHFKRVNGPPAPEASLSTSSIDAISELDDSLPESLERNPITADILRLLRILHEMNANLDELLPSERSAIKVNAEPMAQFVNTKLTAKLNRQLEEPLIVASNCLPAWCEDLARLYPFLFPFETRHLFLQSTSFGYARSMQRWQSAQSGNESRRDRHRDHLGFIGRLQRQKVRISRNKMLESAWKVMDMYGASPSVLEVEYFEEVGTGLGPTLEFYSSVSKDFRRKKLRLWREGDSAKMDEFVFAKQGLFPAPLSDDKAKSEDGQKALGLFKTLGKFVARSMLDSRIIDLSFNPMFFRIPSTSGSNTPSLAAVRVVDEDLAKSLQSLKQYVVNKKKISEQPRLSPAQKALKIAKLQVKGATVEDLGLDFTLPGYPDIELVTGGSSKTVNIDNIDLYIDKVIDFTVGQGVQRQIEAFRKGFSQVFPYSALRAFTPDELVMLFGRAEEDWSMETLMDSIKADHGYNLDSKSVKHLLQIMSEFSTEERRDFLQFITGSPKLPIGGFQNLTPLFTVVCKPAETPLVSDDYLPSVMTCVNYLKLPDYSTYDIMREKLTQAMQLGQGAFHLS